MAEASSTTRDNEQVPHAAIPAANQRDISTEPPFPAELPQPSTPTDRVCWLDVEMELQKMKERKEKDAKR